MFIGITGSMGSGKTTVAKILEERYDDIFSVICADEIVHDCLSNSKIRNMLSKKFPSYDWTKYKRKTFADYVFNNNLAEQLSNYLSPFIFYEMGIMSEEAVANGMIPVLDIPLLYETFFNLVMDINVVIIVDEDTRYKRLEGRGFSKDEVDKRLFLQMSQEEKIKLADYVIDNSRDLDSTNERIDRFVSILKNYDWDDVLIKSALRREFKG